MTGAASGHLENEELAEAAELEEPAENPAPDAPEDEAR
jgi:simple sugar transport system ATP-binding protein